MKSMRRAVVGFVGGVMLGLAMPSLAQSLASLPPDRLIESVSADLLQKIKSDKLIQSGDTARLSALVETTVMPYVDFERLTKFAVGRGWRNANPDQQEALKREFRTLLLYTYSGAMAAIKDHAIRVKPLRSDPGAVTELIVRSDVVSPGKEPISLDYRMEKLPEGWRVYDMSVMSVWLREAHRSQFAQEISKNGIDGLIQSLVSKNNDLALSKK